MAPIAVPPAWTTPGDMVRLSKTGVPERLPVVGPRRELVTRYQNLADAVAVVDTRGIERHDIRGFIYDDDTHDEGLFKRVFDRAGAANVKHLTITPRPAGDGNWSHRYDVADSGATVPAVYAIDVPSGMIVEGMGDGSGKIHLLGGRVAGNGTCFRVMGAKQDIVFYRLHFYGDNGDTNGVGFLYEPNHQSNPIFIRNDVPGNTPINVRTIGCTFENLWGFVYHDVSSDDLNLRGRRGGNDFIDNVCRYCANGVNPSGDGRANYSRNYLESCEGFEITGPANICALNIMHECLGAGMVLGGRSILDPGNVVALNYVHISAAHPADGLRFGDGAIQLTTVGNTIIINGTASGIYGGTAAFGATYKPRDNVHVGNVVVYESGTGIPFYASSRNTVWDSNHAVGNVQSVYMIAADGTVITGGYHKKGSGTPRVFDFSDDGESAQGPINVYINAPHEPFGFSDGTSPAGSIRFQDGTKLNLTSLPAAAAMWQGVNVKVRGTAGIADIDVYAPKDGDDNVYFQHRTNHVISRVSGFTARPQDRYILMAPAASTRTVTLSAAASSKGARHLIKKTDSGAGNVSVDGNASETIDGAVTKTITTQFGFLDIVCDGVAWHIVAQGGTIT